MAKKSGTNSSGSSTQDSAAKARAARSTKGKRNLDKDVWVAQATVSYPVDSPVIAEVKAALEAKGGSLRIKSRVLKRGYEPPPDTEQDESTGSDPEVNEPEVNVAQ